MPVGQTNRRAFIAALGGFAAGGVGAESGDAGGRIPQRNVTWAIDVRSADDVGSVVDRWVTAFNSNDADALVNLYAIDAILLRSTGLILQEGREAIRAYFARLANSGDKVVIGDRKFIMLDDNVSYATGFYEFSAVRNGEVRRSWAGFSLVLMKHTNDWFITHHHSSERSSPSPSLPLQRI